jgi:hypothetical protein
MGITRVAEDRREDGWTVIELELLGGPDRAADVVQRLITAGAVIARFERVGTSLADLIERVVHAAKEGRRA